MNLSRNKNTFLVVVSSLLLVTACVQKSANVEPKKAVDTVISIPGGKVEGKIDGDLLVFKGIPYAAPPIANNRWRAPQAVPSWDGIRQANSFGHDCMQQPFPSDAAPLGETPAEDCLYLNVWTPTATGSPAPVVLWIYGGGFVNGGASPSVYDGAQFAKAGVTFVSFNYRLGRFGFFAHPALSAANEGKLGNYAFMDQIAALEWVKNNIAKFNGDPNNITVMGESAGGGSVHTLMQTPLSQNLFQRAIIMSGGGRSLMGERSMTQGTELYPSAEQIGLNFAEKHHIEGTGPEALAQMRALPAEEVLDGLGMMALFMPQQGKPTYVGGPVADGEIVRGSAQEMLKKGEVSKIPVMVGTTSQDIGFGMAKDKDQLFSSFGEFAQEARAAYDPDGTVPLQKLNMDVAQDRSMQEPARYFAEQVTQLGQPAYLYRFSYVAEEIRKGSGAQHATDIPFFFNTIDKKYTALTDQDKKAATLSFRYFVNFIKTGNPNGPDLSQWQAFDPATDNIMDITMDATAIEGSDPWKPRLDAVQKALEAKGQ